LLFLELFQRLFYATKVSWDLVLFLFIVFIDLNGLEFFIVKLLRRQQNVRKMLSKDWVLTNLSKRNTTLRIQVKNSCEKVFKLGCAIMG